MEPNPYEAPKEAGYNPPRRKPSALRVLMYLLVALPPAGCVSFFSIAATVQYWQFNHRIARLAFFALTGALLLAILATSISASGRKTNS